MTRLLLFLLPITTSCVPGSIKFDPNESVETDKDTDTGEQGDDTSDTGSPDSSDTGDSGDTSDTNSLVDSSDSGDTSDSGEDSGEPVCDWCTGVLSVDPQTVELEADGTDTSVSVVNVFGWTTGLDLLCSASLAHLTWDIADTDTSSSGSTEITFGVTGAFAGEESGLCVLTSDYDEEPVEIQVELNTCVDCTGISSCSSYEILIGTSNPYTATFSGSTTCYGTATGIEVSCATSTGAAFTRFSTSLSTTDTSASGTVTLTTSASDVYYFSEWGFCELTDDQGSSVSVCVYECNVGSCTNPCP